MDDMDLLHQKLNQVLSQAGCRAVVDPTELAEIDRLTLQIEQEDECHYLTPDYSKRSCLNEPVDTVNST